MGVGGCVCGGEGGLTTMTTTGPCNRKGISYVGRVGIARAARFLPPVRRFPMALYIYIYFFYLCASLAPFLRG